MWDTTARIPFDESFTSLLVLHIAEAIDSENNRAFRMTSSAAMVRAEVRRVIEIVSAIACESVHRDRIFSKTRGKVPMRNDEARGIIVIAEVATESRAVDADLKIFPNLKMQMRVIPPMRCAECSD